MDIIEAVIKDDMEELKRCMDGGNLNEQDAENGYTALHYCAQNGNAQMAKMLIEKGASVSMKDNYGNTALFKAVFYSQGKTDIIQMLLDAGADADAENDAGMSPRKVAENIADFDVTGVFR